ncbi:MAG: hypothetical protein R2706_12460 [Acidimicrobiales bacterium]
MATRCPFEVDLLAASYHAVGRRRLGRPDRAGQRRTFVLTNDAGVATFDALADHVTDEVVVSVGAVPDGWVDYRGSESVSSAFTTAEPTTTSDPIHRILHIGHDVSSSSCFTSSVTR